MADVAPVPSIVAPPAAAAGLRSFAAHDPIVSDAAGTTLLARMDELDAGELADLVALAMMDGELLRHAWLEVDPLRRVRLVEAKVAGL